MKKVLFLLLVIAVCAWRANTAPLTDDECTMEDLVNAIGTKYAAVDTLAADFTQKNFIASLNQFREFQGTLALKRPHLFSMQVVEPSAQELVFDGQFYWVYTAATEQVLKNPVPPDFTEHPLINLIETMENLDEDFIISQGITRSADEYSLTLTLKKPETDIEGAHLTVSKQGLKIRAIVLRYCSGNYTQFILSNVEENPEIPPERFEFQPPPGVEIIENPMPAA